MTGPEELLRRLERVPETKLRLLEIARLGPEEEPGPEEIEQAREEARIYWQQTGQLQRRIIWLVHRPS